MLDESDYLSPSVDQGPSCLIIVLCPQLKLSVGRRSVRFPELAGREAAVSPPLPSRPHGVAVEPSRPIRSPQGCGAAGPRAPPTAQQPRSRPGLLSWASAGVSRLVGRSRRCDPSEGAPPSLDEEPLSTFWKRLPPGRLAEEAPVSRWPWRLGDLLPPLSLPLEKTHRKNRWRAPRH